MSADVKTEVGASKREAPLGGTNKDNDDDDGVPSKPDCVDAG